MPAQNGSQGLPLKFRGGTFGAIKIFWEKIFTGSSTGCRPEIPVQVWLWNLWATMVAHMLFTKVMDALFSSYTNLGTRVPKNDATITRKKTTQLFKYCIYTQRRVSYNLDWSTQKDHKTKL